MAAGLLGTVIGLVLLGIALFRSRVVPRWIPVALWLFIVTEFVLTNVSEWASPAAGLLYVAAFTGIAVQLVRGEDSSARAGEELRVQRHPSGAEGLGCHPDAGVDEPPRVAAGHGRLSVQNGGMVRTRPQVVAHRGASATNAEHTLGAYVAALDEGAEALECDVRLTADGHLVCVHDRDLRRLAQTDGIVSAMELADLEDLDFAAWKNPWGEMDDEAPDRDPELAKVLTMRRLLETAADYPRRVELAIETKHPTRYAGLVERRLVQLLDEFGWAGKDSPVRVMSFSWVALRRIRRQAPDLDLVMLMETPDPLVPLPAVRRLRLAGRAGDRHGQAPSEPDHPHHRERHPGALLDGQHSCGHRPVLRAGDRSDHHRHAWGGSGALEIFAAVEFTALSWGEISRTGG